VPLFLIGVALLLGGNSIQGTGCTHTLPSSQAIAAGPWIARTGLALAALCAGFYGRAIVSNVYGAIALGFLLLAFPPVLLLSMGECA